MSDYPLFVTKSGLPESSKILIGVGPQDLFFTYKGNNKSEDQRTIA